MATGAAGRRLGEAFDTERQAEGFRRGELIAFTVATDAAGENFRRQRLAEGFGRGELIAFTVATPGANFRRPGGLFDSSNLAGLAVAAAGGWTFVAADSVGKIIRSGGNGEGTNTSAW